MTQSPPELLVSWVSELQNMQESEFPASGFYRSVGQTKLQVTQENERWAFSFEAPRTNQEVTTIWSSGINYANDFYDLPRRVGAVVNVYKQEWDQPQRTRIF